MRKLTIISPWLAMLALAACDTATPPVAQPSSAETAAQAQFKADNQLWRDQRRESLLRPDGWTSLVGLHWLQLKDHYIGSGERSGIRLEVGPDKMGMVSQRGGQVFFTPERGVELTLNGETLAGRVELFDDHQPQPSVVGFDEGKGQLTVIQRGGRHALRVKHADAASRLQFSGLAYWPLQPSWKLEARFIPHPAGKTMPVVDIIGITTPSPNPGVVEFSRDGRTFRLEAMGEPDGGLFLVFADRTSGHGSYPAGRFLDTAAPVDGKVMLDFNRAYNPPCAFTPFATCPLPPPENRLDVAIEAGEKAYKPPQPTH